MKSKIKCKEGHCWCDNARFIQWIDASKPSTVLESIEGLPGASATTKAVVIFFENNCKFAISFDEMFIMSLLGANPKRLSAKIASH
jgi:hypothetical protein